MPGRRMQHTKWKAANNGAVRRHWSSGVFFRGKCTIYDFPMAFEYQRAPLHFFGSPLFILEGLFHPRVLTTGQLPPQRWREHMERAGWCWNIYGSVVLWLHEFWQRWHILPLPKQKAWCVAVCCGLERWDRVHASPPYTDSPNSKYLHEHKRQLSRYWSSVCFFYFLLLHYFLH